MTAITARWRSTFKSLLATLPILIAFAGAPAWSCYPDPNYPCYTNTVLAAALQAMGSGVGANFDIWEAQYGSDPGMDFGGGGQGTYSGHLGMYVSSGTPDQQGWGAAGGGSIMRSSGIGVTDTAGILAPGATVNFRDTSGNGGLFYTIDATRFFGIPANQSLFLTGFFDYRGGRCKLGSRAGCGRLGHR